MAEPRSSYAGNGTDTDGRVSPPTDSTLAPGLKRLPAPVRTDVFRLHRAMRSLDDLVDKHQPEAQERIDAVDRWTQGEDIDTPETRALAEVNRRSTLPVPALREFCNGMRHDLERDTIDTEADLELYCQRVAGTVATMLATLLGVMRPDGETKMATLGRAMQRTNILRDIDEDAANGRLYIARTTIERFGPPTPGAREDLLRDQIARADALYDEGMSAIPLLSQGRHAIALCVASYREILRQIERDGYGRRSGTVAVPRWRGRVMIANYALQRIPQALARAISGGQETPLESA